MNGKRFSFLFVIIYPTHSTPTNLSPTLAFTYLKALRSLGLVIPILQAKAKASPPSSSPLPSLSSFLFIPTFSHRLPSKQASTDQPILPKPNPVPKGHLSRHPSHSPYHLSPHDQSRTSVQSI